MRISPLLYKLKAFSLLFSSFGEAQKIKKGTAYTTEALSDEITSLPDLKFSPGFRMFSGYLDLPDNEVGSDRHIFYWYVESQQNPSTDPLIYWTNGGPGCSGLQGIGFIHGPFRFNKNGINENEYSWNKLANMLYIEQPIGVGFSYTNDDLTTYTDFMAAEEQYEVLVAFYKKFPSMKPNELILSSESYGGHYIPTLALHILEEVKDTSINLKGIAIGNPYVSSRVDDIAYYQNLYRSGLVSQTLWKRWLKNYCKFSYRKVVKGRKREGPCDDIEWDIWKNIGSTANEAAVDYPICPKKPFKFPDRLAHNSENIKRISISDDGNQILKRMHERISAAHSNKVIRNEEEQKRLALSQRYEPCRKEYFIEYLHRTDVQDAIHADGSKVNTTFWQPCNDRVFWNFPDEDYYRDNIPFYKQLATGGYGLDIMIYSGDNDGITPYIGTSRWIYKLGLTPEKGHDWNEWVIQRRQAGFITKFDTNEGANSFVFVTLKGAGHEAPAYKPEESLEMLHRYIQQDWEV